MKFDAKLMLGCLLALSQMAIAQQNGATLPCGTTEGRSPWLESYQHNPSGYPRTNDTLYVPMTLHVVGTNGGTGYYPIQEVLRAFCELNEDFKGAAIQFFIEGPVRYINNSTYYSHDFDQGYQMMEENNVPNTLNAYIVNYAAGACGYSYYGTGVALAIGCVGPGDNTWAHETGHQLSLPHTFYGWEGYDHNYSQPAPVEVNGDEVEKMDGSNCAFVADGFCDTKPDYLNYRWACDTANFSTLAQKDPDGVEFKSDGSLFMSYSLDICSSRFSDEQIGAMRADLLDQKPDHLYNQTPVDPVVMAPLSMASPMEGDSVATYKNVLFEWEHLENATHYLLEIATFPDFPFVVYRYAVEGNSFLVTKLSKNKNYYWRLRPYNRRHTCLQATEVHHFKTGDVLLPSATASIQAIDELGLMPNPIGASDQALTVSIGSSRAFEAEMTVADLAGRRLQSAHWLVREGQQQFQLPIAGWPAGVYLMQLRSGEGIEVRRFVVGR